MISIAMFNNKGGVGKTTLTANIASFISEYHGKKVLIVDCDPQCNTTQLLMGQDYSLDLYYSQKYLHQVTTVSDIFQPIEDGDARISEQIIPINKKFTRFNVDLIPGNPKFSIIEDRLGAAWHDLKGGDTGGFRITNWNSVLIDKIKKYYDLVFYDLGPSLGSINRSVLIGCDYFVTPMGTDIFSILGIKNIAEWISTWIQTYEHSLSMNEPRKLMGYGVQTDLKIKKGYLGYTIQQYITKTIKGERRPTKAYEEIINNVPHEIQSSLGTFTEATLSGDDLKLGDVPHLYSLIPLAQSNYSPLFKLKTADGLVGTQFKQVDDYRILLNKIVEKLFANLTKKNHELA